MNSNITKKNDKFTEKLKEIVTKRWDEEKKKAEIPYDEAYKQMVEEAVLVIKAAWELDAKYIEKPKNEANSIKLASLNSFFITKEDSMIYSSNGFRTQNPRTGKCCFFSSFQFKSEEDIAQYIKDVLALLPENATYTETEVNEVVFGESKKYSFFLDLKMV